MKPIIPAGEPDPALVALEIALRNAYGTDGVLALDEVVEMPGGASTRRFFRVPLDGTTVIGMYMPAPSQEIAKARQVTLSETFIEVRNLLASRGVRVPEILHASAHHQLLFVEDLGDATLAQFLLDHESERTSLYQMAVRDAAHARLALAELPPNSSIHKRAFDRDLLFWEVEHFRDWALEARGIQLSPSDRELFDEAARYLAETIDKWPRGFVHRDYQSRNLMVRQNESAGNELVWIDFQDAMLGPRVYDLVALLTDSYQSFSRAFIEERLREYASIAGVDFEELVFEFDFVTVQRKLKDAGRFIFIDRVNGNPNFLGYVDSTIEKARRALARVSPREPNLRRLEELLNRLCGKLSPD